VGAGADLFHVYGLSLSHPLHFFLFVYPVYSSSSCTTILLHPGLVVYREDLTSGHTQLLICFFISYDIVVILIYSVYSRRDGILNMTEVYSSTR